MNQGTFIFFIFFAIFFQYIKGLTSYQIFALASRIAALKIEFDCILSLYLLFCFFVVHSGLDNSPQGCHHFPSSTLPNYIELKDNF